MSPPRASALTRTVRATTNYQGSTYVSVRTYFLSMGLETSCADESRPHADLGTCAYRSHWLQLVRAPPVLGNFSNPMPYTRPHLPTCLTHIDQPKNKLIRLLS